MFLFKRLLVLDECIHEITVSWQTDIFILINNTYPDSYTTYSEYVIKDKVMKWRAGIRLRDAAYKAIAQLIDERMGGA